jgi:hypothetical protein
MITDVNQGLCAAAQSLVRERRLGDLIPYGSSGVKPVACEIFGCLFVVAGVLAWPPGGGRAAGAGGYWCQVMGLTAWARCRDDRGRGGSPRLTGPVVAV